MNNEYDPLIIGKNIKRRRKEMDYSQSDLSELIDMEKSEVCKYENGKIKGMRVDTLFRFCSALEVNMNEMVYENEPLDTGDGCGVLYIKSENDFRQLVKAFRIMERTRNEHEKEN